MRYSCHIRQEEWNGAKDLHDILDFSDIPEEMREFVQNYHIHVIDVRRLKDTSVFKTDVKQVFDFIRCSKDKKKLKNLINSDSNFQSMDHTAVQFMSHYANADQLLESISTDSNEGGNVNMCQALKELLEDARKMGEDIGIELEKKETIPLQSSRRGIKINSPTSHNICNFYVILAKTFYPSH